MSFSKDVSKHFNFPTAWTTFKFGSNNWTVLIHWSKVCTLHFFLLSDNPALLTGCGLWVVVRGVLFNDGILHPCKLFVIFNSIIWFWNKLDRSVSQQNTSKDVLKPSYWLKKWKNSRKWLNSSEENKRKVNRILLIFPVDYFYLFL